MSHELPPGVVFERPTYDHIPGMLAVMQEATIKSFTEELGLPEASVKAYVHQPHYEIGKTEHWRSVIDGKFSAHLLVATDHSGGVLSVSESSEHYPGSTGPTLGTHYVRPDAQGQYIGSDALKAVLAPYEGRRTRLAVLVGSRAIKFYEDHNFVGVRELSGFNFGLPRYLHPPYQEVISIPLLRMVRPDASAPPVDVDEPVSYRCFVAGLRN